MTKSRFFSGLTMTFCAEKLGSTLGLVSFGEYLPGFQINSDKHPISKGGTNRSHHYTQQVLVGSGSVFWDLHKISPYLHPGNKVVRTRIDKHLSIYR